MSPTRTIVLLDDDAAHLNAMGRRLSKRFGSLVLRTFREAGPLIDWLASPNAHCALLSLDDELGARDAGTGCDVSDWLIGKSPFCPVVLHGGSPVLAPRMEHVLTVAGWECPRVIPNDHADWIDETWYPAVRELLVDDA